MSGRFKDTTYIHYSSLNKYINHINEIFNLDITPDRYLGSTGKKQTMGDLDIAVTPEEQNRIEKISKAAIFETAKSGMTFSVCLPVPADYGDIVFCQVDFIAGDLDVLKLFYHSPHPVASKYSGEYRTILCQTFFNLMDRFEHGDEANTTDLWNFSPKYGLRHERRQQIPRKDGKGYTKKSHVVEIGKVRTNMNDIEIDYGMDLDSFESIWWNIRYNDEAEFVKKVAKKFCARHEVKKIPYEMKDYI